MRLKEQKLWDRTRKNLGKFSSATIRLERFENLVSDGVPDCLALCEGVVTWIELKAVLEPPARPTTRLIPSGSGLSIEQRNWHLDWQKHKGRSLILVGVGSDINIAVDGKLADRVNFMPLHEMIEASAATNWAKLASVLRGEK